MPLAAPDDSAARLVAGAVARAKKDAALVAEAAVAAVPGLALDAAEAAEKLSVRASLVAEAAAVVASADSGQDSAHDSLVRAAAPRSVADSVEAPMAGS